MDGDGSIHGGTLVRLLDSGEILRVDDDDKWRSSRDAPSPDEPTRWYGVRRLGFTDVTGQRIYVRDDRIEALDEQEDRDAGAALHVQAIYGAEVAAEVERMCQTLGIEQQVGTRIDTRIQAIRCFAWAAKIGDLLPELMGDLQARVQLEIRKRQPKATADELNENTADGMLFDRQLIEPINRSLKTLMMVLTGFTHEMLESLIDASGGSGGDSHLPGVMEGVMSDRIVLVDTLKRYLQFGREAMLRALRHGEASWNKALLSTLDALGGCFAAQAQQLESVQPAEQLAAPLMDPAYKEWTVDGSVLGSMGIQQDGEDIASLKELDPSKPVRSQWVNPDFDYRIVKITDTEVRLQVVG